MAESKIKRYCLDRFAFLQTRKIYVFGVGEIGMKTVEALLTFGLHVHMIIDNNSSKQGSTFAGIPIYSLDKYRAEATDKDFILVALVQDRQVIRQLEDAGISQYRYDSILKAAPEDVLQGLFEEIHTHIEYTYLDIMVVLEKQLAFVAGHNVTLVTDYPIAYESIDHLYPHGTIRDNTRFPRFIKKCETFFPEKKELAFLDLGCSGGGMVLDAVLRGHFGVGLEGSDTSLILQRAEWRLLKNNLFTCDITKPYALVNQEFGTKQLFDVITAWEVLEHIGECDLEMFFHNVMKHLAPSGIFAASIANWDDIDPDTGVNWHVTVKPYEWWVEKCEQFGFEVCSEIIHTLDLPRGGTNHPIPYKEPSVEIYPDCFHIVVQAKKGGEPNNG